MDKSLLSYYQRLYVEQGEMVSENVRLLGIDVLSLGKEKSGTQLDTKDQNHANSDKEEGSQRIHISYM